jgi:hypothetical protein
MSSDNTGTFSYGHCATCGTHGYLRPLHGEKGGPRCCLVCSGKWDAEHVPKRRARRGVIRALRAYSEVGGHLFGKDLDDIRWAASGFLDDAAAETVDYADLTSELLAATLALTHPDKHPSERKAEALRVTQELLKLKPFVFPAPPPKPAPKPRDVSVKPLQPDTERAVTGLHQYPCEDCRTTDDPTYYCDACKARWDKEREQEKARDEEKRQAKNAKQRESYRLNKACGERYAKPALCDSCGNAFEPKRRDARYCSAACRQRAYVKRDGNPSNARPLGRAEIEQRIADVFTANPDSAFTARDLCGHVYPGLKTARKHRDAVVDAAKKACERLGPYRDWWRASDWAFGLRGAPLVFFNYASIISYALARLKSDSSDCHKSEQAMLKLLAPGGTYHRHVVEGGAWWRHCQERLTDQQDSPCSDLTIRHTSGEVSHAFMGNSSRHTHHQNHYSRRGRSPRPAVVCRDDGRPRAVHFEESDGVLGAGAARRRLRSGNAGHLHGRPNGR